MYGFTPTHRCMNPHCREVFHFTRVCPTSVQPRRLSEEELETWYELRRLTRERELARAKAQAWQRPLPSEPEVPRPDPGYAWLLVFIPAALLVGGVMLALMFL